MGKIIEIKLVGQTIFKQILNLITGTNIKGLINKQQSDRYYKAFKTRTHLITMLPGIFSRCDSMTEICEGLRAFQGKLNHLGLEKAPAKSTACDGLRNRDSAFFEELYFSLVKRYHSFLSDSRTFGLTIKEVLLIDSTTIRLFSDILKGVGRNPNYPVITHSGAKDSPDKESILGCGIINPDTFDQHAGCIRNAAQHQTGLWK